MSGLKLYLFGPPRLERDGTPINITRRKAKALLAYLAMTRQSHSREALATLFWPDYDSSQGRLDLSRTISVLNKALGAGWLITDRETVEFDSKANPSAGNTLWVDVVHFQQLLAACEAHGHPEAKVCADCLSPLAEAVALYQSDFLAGFTQPDSSAFDEWQFFQTESLRQALASALQRLVRGHSTQGDTDPKSAISYARRWLALDPLHEPAHRQLMELYAQTGQQAAAVRQYQACVRILDEELGVLPQSETTALYERIRQGSDHPAATIANRFTCSELDKDSLGQGSIGSVYRGTDTQTGEPVAVKILKPDIVTNHPELVERFIREGEALRQLNHPNIVKMLAITEKKGQYYLVMEYVGGGSLQDLLKGQERLPIARVVEIGLELADALTRAHHLNIIHRDLKPANVLLTVEGIPRLTDFGIAHMADSPTLTQTGAVMGTVGYLSPEACQGESLDARTDLWAFGVLLYEMLTGERPFTGETMAATLSAILTEPLPDIRQVRYEVPQALADLIGRMLEKEPQQRISSVRLVGAELEAILRGKEAGEPRSSVSTFPSFLEQEVEPGEVEGSVFVAREHELRQLDSHFQAILEGQGRVVFISGEAGSGKTTLLREFAWQAQESHGELIVANGNCNAFSGTGDPYLPFRDVMGMLSGDVETLWAAGAIRREHARRLWHLSPYTTQALISDGPDLLDVFVSGTALIRRIEAHSSGETAWLPRLKQLAARQKAGAGQLEQQQLFEQYSQVLHNLASQNPLLLWLDDLQWADSGSINLLFHLARRLQGGRILILGSYRPSEVRLGRSLIGAEQAQQHPLEMIVNELKRQFGDIQIDLGRSESAKGRDFIDAFLDSEPNQLDESFRAALFERTKGHPLFTVELLRDMQERGDLIQNEQGQWIEGQETDWQALPIRAEAVIEQRIGRLGNELRDILTVASVEGEEFTAQVVAHVHKVDEWPLLRHLSQELEKRHHLVREREEIEVANQRLSRYQFGHVMFQRYLYNRLSLAERRLLHAQVAETLEELYEGHTEQITMQLAHHYLEAGQSEKAIEYARHAAWRAEAMYAYDEAAQHLHTALGLIKPGPGGQVETRMAMLEQLADVYAVLGERPRAILLYRNALDLWHSFTNADKMIAVRLHRKIGQMVVSMTWFADKQRFEATAQASFEAGLKLAEDEPPHPETVRLLVTLSSDAWKNRKPEDWDTAEHYARAAVAMAEELDTPVELSFALDALAIVYGARDLFRERVEASLRRLALSRDPRFSNVREQARILQQTGFALMQVGEYGEAIPYLLEAESLSSQVEALDHHFRALRYQAYCWLRLDHWDRVLEIEEKWHTLEQRYPNYVERVGATCFMIALGASVHALRGDLDRARPLREEARATMIAQDGPAEGWERSNRY